MNTAFEQSVFAAQNNDSAKRRFGPTKRRFVVLKRRFIFAKRRFVLQGFRQGTTKLQTLLFSVCCNLTEIGFVIWQNERARDEREEIICKNVALQWQNTIPKSL